MTIGQKLAKTAIEALETLAKTEFSRENIVEACRVAAMQGFMSCDIKPSVPVDVSQTAAIKDITTELKKEWLEMAWIARAVPGEPSYKILQVRWTARRGQ